MACLSGDSESVYCRARDGAAGAQLSPRCPCALRWSAGTSPSCQSRSRRFSPESLAGPDQRAEKMPGEPPRTSTQIPESSAMAGRPEMRAALTSLTRFMVTPHVSKHRLFIWLSGDVVPDHQLIVIARDDDYFFGVLQSKIHELWALRLGTSLEDRPRYTPTTTFETFPFPWPPGREPADDPRVAAIGAAARGLVVWRDRWLNLEGADEAELKKRTLTNLYNARPTWLDNAHKKLDAAVLDAYGWPHDISDDEILARLLALNLERAAAQGGAAAAAPADLH